MKILCTADIHIGQQAYSTLNPNTGLNTRVEHTLRIFDGMIDYAINNCDMFIFAGDMFKNNLPSPTLQDEVYKRIKKLSDNKIQTIIIDGNHDVSKLQTTKSSMKAFETFDLPYIKHSKFLEKFTYNGVNFVLLPTYTDKEELNEICQNIDKESILIGHFTVLGAKLNDWLVEMNEANVSKEVFTANPNIKALILGHLHKYQILNENPLIFYTGSPDRIDFTEETDKKGFVVIDTDGYSYEFVENDAQKFCTIKEDVCNENNVDDFIIHHIDLYKDLIDKAVVRLIVKLNADQEIDEKLIYKHINQYNPNYIVTIQKQYTSKKYVRDTNITSDLDINKAIEIYFKGQEREKERITIAKQLVSDI